jgi:hypothetical protein
VKSPHVHTDITRVDLGGPRAAVGVTGSGGFAVIADERLSARTAGHALQYAERLAALIPHPRREYVGRHRAPETRGEHREAS